MFFITMFLVVIVVFVCMIIIQARFNPEQNNLITKKRKQLIAFLNSNKKSLKKGKSIISTTVIVISILGLLFFYLYTLPRNSDAEKYVDNYIQNSTDIELIYVEPEEIDLARNSPDFEEFGIIYGKYSKSQTIYTGLKIMGKRGKTQRVTYRTEIFQDKNSQNYYQLMYIGSGTMFILNALLRDGLIINAKINKYYLSNSKYGTLENPIPVMMWSFPRWVGNEDYEESKITEERYWNHIYYYLAYLMPKEDFKKKGWSKHDKNNE